MFSIDAAEKVFWGHLSINGYSSGILLFRQRDGHLEVLLVHPGGPFWVNKDDGSWSIPKGMVEREEDPLDAAKREFAEETGSRVDGTFVDLGQLRQSRKRVVHIWALQGDLDPGEVSSNSFSIEWPKRSGIIREYPEVDRADWFDIGRAREKIQKGQAPFIDRLIEAVNRSPDMERGRTSEDQQVHYVNTSGARDDPPGKKAPDKGRPARKSSSSQLSLGRWIQD